MKNSFTKVNSIKNNSETSPEFKLKFFNQYSLKNLNEVLGKLRQDEFNEIKNKKAPNESSGLIKTLKKYYACLETKSLIHCVVTDFGLTIGIPTALAITVCAVTPSVLETANKTV